MKNIGYRRSGKENWADIYAKYIDSPFVQADPNLKTVIQEHKNFGFVTTENRDPVEDKDLERYTSNANSNFLRFIKEKFPFEPDWGHW